MSKPSNIVLPISGNRYISIAQNKKDNGYDKQGIVYGDYGEKVEIAILNSDFILMNEAFDSEGVKGFLDTKDLINELSKLIERT
tara:strand:- start:433 stop:684 length:252 start_codon:yes stop_codon:yes gene_type:complete